VKRINFDDTQLTAFDTVSLGALTDALAQLEVAEALNDEGHPPQWRSVFFDFGGLVPHYFDSYRGYYDHMAITFTGESAAEVRQLVAKLKAADGEVFSGYKGGDYRMNRATPVWVANHGECDGTAIVGLLVESYRVTILTEYKP
jgi:hypothetical protein